MRHSLPAAVPGNSPRSGPHPPQRSKSCRRWCGGWRCGTELVQQEENRRQSGGSSSAVRASIEAPLAFLRQELAKTPRLVQQQVERSAQLKEQQQLLCSLPGVGAWTAARGLAEIEVLRASV